MDIPYSVDRKMKPARGRPRADAGRHVSSALLDAAESALRLKGHGELTSREIASLACTNQAMIKYYFDGKEGLFSTLIEIALNRVVADLQQFERDLGNVPGNPTKSLITLLTHHYFSAAPLYKVLMNELRNDNSSIRNRYVKRGSRTFLHVCRILQKFVKLGFFKADTNIRYAAFTIACLIEAPIALSPVIDQMGFTMGELNGDPWISHVTTMLETQFGVAGRV
jgi:AcrR family transcriptional regulator